MVLGEKHGTNYLPYTKYMSENSIKSEREINKKNVTSGHYADVFLIYIIKHTRRKWAETLG